MNGKIYAKTGGGWQQVYPHPNEPTVCVLAASGIDTGAALSWSESRVTLPDSVVSYEISQDGAITNVGNVLLTNVSGLTNGVTYVFKVRSVTSQGVHGAWSNEVSVVPTIRNAALGGTVSDFTVAAYTRTNLCTNPSFETDLSGWAITASPVVITRVAGGALGDWCMNVNPSGNTVQFVRTDNIACVPGDVFAVSMWVKSTTDQYFGINFNPRTSADANISSTIGPYIMCLTGVWTEVKGVYTMPANTASVRVGIDNPASSSQYQVDKVMIEKAAATFEWFDGETLSVPSVTYRRHLFETPGEATLTVQANPLPFRVTMIAGGAESGYADNQAGDGTAGGGGGAYFGLDTLGSGDLTLQVGRGAQGAYINVPENDTIVPGVGTVGGGGHGRRVWNNTGRYDGRPGTWGGHSDGGKGAQNLSDGNLIYDPRLPFKTLIDGTTDTWGDGGNGISSSGGGTNPGIDGVIVIEYQIA